jgi:hypothetical protein
LSVSAEDALSLSMSLSTQRTASGTAPLQPGKHSYIFYRHRKCLLCLFFCAGRKNRLDKRIICVIVLIEQINRLKPVRTAFQEKENLKKTDERR